MTEMQNNHKKENTQEMPSREPLTHDPVVSLSENLTAKLEHLLQGNPEAERGIAAQKLKKLLGLKKFAIRFVNEGEYERILRNGNFGTGNEAVVFNCPFTKFLEERKKNKDWIKLIDNETDWTLGVTSLGDHRTLLQLIKQAHEQVLKTMASSEEKKSIRSKTMRALRPLLIAEIQQGGGWSLTWRDISRAPDLSKRNQEIIDQFRTSLQPDEAAQLITLLDTESEHRVTMFIARQFQNVGGNAKNEIFQLANEYIKNQEILEKVQKLDQKLVTTISEFLDKPDYLDKEGNLERLVHACTALQASNDRGTLVQQYHLALIFDAEALDYSRKEFIAHPLRSPKDTLFKPEDHLLGTVVVLPQRKLVEQIVHNSAEAGNFTHPVFDSGGLLRYPNKK